MSKKDEGTKPKYEAPIVIPLGGLAKGAGACTAGSGDTDACTAGPLAQTACTAGVTNNGATCSDGGSASPTCTGGTSPG
ncbi:MAG: hypothetical protein CVU62_01280 [Deltaproteobacteria bacterium HGW-Deltaproteobacteria-2]|jgi:hypothetical protein|nr:MAG: hypothetical protein CVU62_01280 [Deltaproteobacteria bacterium HGW-Deltaproteobacteria-2]